MAREPNAARNVIKCSSHMVPKFALVCGSLVLKIYVAHGLRCGLHDCGPRSTIFYICILHPIPPPKTAVSYARKGKKLTPSKWKTLICDSFRFLAVEMWPVAENVWNHRCKSFKMRVTWKVELFALHLILLNNSC